MGKKEYEAAAKIVREFRSSGPDPRSGNVDDPTEGTALQMEQAFAKLFNQFDTKGRFDSRRFFQACRSK